MTDSPRLPVLRPGRAYLFNYAVTVAREALERPDSMSNPILTPQARGVLATITQDASARRAVETEICLQPDTGKPSTNLRVRVLGLPAEPAEGELRLLTGGTNELRCAVEGHVEGVRCTSVPGTDPVWVAVGIPSLEERYSRLRAAEWNLDTDMASSFAYVVRRREDRSGGPGGYEAIAGIPLPLPEGLTSGDCTTLAFDFSSDERAGATMAVTSHFDPEHVCGYEGPLPLEDEIVEDGDPYEDSWQHHLRVAAASAAHADELGQQLIQSGLQMDMRAEGAVDQIQNLCGAHINLDELFDASGDLIDLVHPTASCDEASNDYDCVDPMAPTVPLPDYECVGTICVVSAIVADDGSADRRAIRECLGVGDAGETVPVVALGEVPLCYWYADPAGGPVEHRRICEGAPAGTCPFPLPRAANGSYEGMDCGTTATGFDAMSETMAVVANRGIPGWDGHDSIGSTLDGDEVPEVLGLIGSVDPSTEGSIIGTDLGSEATRPTQEVCDAIRDFANDSDDAESLATIRESNFFEYDNVRHWAGRIGWRGYPRDFSEITLDGAPWKPDGTSVVGSTGLPLGFGGRAPFHGTAWPCAAYSGVGSGGSLFQTTVSGGCGDMMTGVAQQDERAVMNIRMGRAVATLSGLAGLGFGNLLMPAYYAGTTVNVGEGDGLQRMTDIYGDTWDVASSADFNGNTMSGIIAAPVSGTPTAWTTITAYAFDDEVTLTTPIAFLGMGARFKDNDESRAENIARVMWECLASSDCDSDGRGGGDYGFWDVLNGGAAGGASGAAPPGNLRLVFQRALTSGFAHETTFLNHGRNAYGETNFGEVAGMFDANAFDLGGDSSPNHAHLFQDHGSNYGASITRRDLLDAMEIMCEVARSVPENDIPPEPERPVVFSMADVGGIQLYAERSAEHIDTVARRQVVQDVPLDVVQAMLGTATSTPTDDGGYGRLVNALRQNLRTQGEAPRDIAAAFRAIATQVEIMKRNAASFTRSLAIEFLQAIATVLQGTLTCSTADPMVIGAACGTAGALAGIHNAISLLRSMTIVDEFQNQFDEFSLQISNAFDLIQSRMVDLQNAAEEVRRILSELRSARRGARSALAQALFAGSDSAGRHYPVNTVMRRGYDINLQRYRSALRASIDSASIARSAIEQRFGVDLEEQTCASFVEPPSQWAADICNTTGVNYGLLRDPDADFGPDAIRRLFIGDYVRRLERYVESYRFDFPYSSGDDLVVVSLRDDVVRATSPCPAEVSNVLGSSNDLLAYELPLPEGTVASAPLMGWGPAPGGCDVDASGETRNCVVASVTDGPRFAMDMSTGLPGPVTGLVSAQPPRGFVVTFAPSTGDEYTDASAWVQPVMLGGGVYRLSWYEKGNSNEPAIDARTTVTTDSGGTIYSASERPMSDGWTRNFRFIAVPSTPETGTLHYIGVFPEPMESSLHEQSVTIAGLQLDDVTGTAAGDTWLSMGTIVPADHGPGPFAATTAPGWAVYDACEEGDPAAFRDRWTYHCTRLCSGGFGSGRCVPGEEPEEFCYHELAFQIDEESPPRSRRALRRGLRLRQLQLPNRRDRNEHRRHRCAGLLGREPVRVLRHRRPRVQLRTPSPGIRR